MATKISDITTHATTPLNGDERMEMAQDGSTVYVTPQDIADLAGGGGGDTIYTADGTIADASRFVTLPEGAILSFGTDDNNRVYMTDDGGMYFGIVYSSQPQIQVGENLFLSYVPTSTRKIISDQSDNFAATGYSGTMYTNFNAMSNFFATLGNAEVGVFYEFAATSSDYSLAIRPDTDNVIVFWDAAAGSRAVAEPEPLSYLQLLPGQSATLTCVETGVWFATVNNGGTYVID